MYCSSGLCIGLPMCSLPVLQQRQVHFQKSVLLLAGEKLRPFQSQGPPIGSQTPQTHSNKHNCHSSAKQSATDTTGWQNQLHYICTCTYNTPTGDNAFLTGGQSVSLCTITGRSPGRIYTLQMYARGARQSEF